MSWAYPAERFRRDQGESWRLYDRRGVLLREAVGGGGLRARWVELHGVSEHVQNATLAAEDERFYSHSGVDALAVLRALRQNLAERRIVSGASTVTMQLARLLGQFDRRTWASKLRQAIDAWRLEGALGKSEILEQYFNRVPYGAGAVGIEAASQRYFGKPNLHLSLAEAALLAGLPKAPSVLNPLRNPSKAQRRQRYVLDRMLELGFIDDAAHRRATEEPLALVPRPPGLHAAHFTDYVLAKAPPPGDVHTTVDLGVQLPVERLLREHVASLKSGGLTNAAAIVVDNAQCDVVAMVGSADYWDSEAGANNGALALRQPGSALKPFLYAHAFENGYDPGSALSDIPTQYPGADGSLLRPRNYQERFNGPVLAGDALGRSLNVPAIRLANAVGAEELLGRLREAGFTSLERDAEHYGLGLALGNGEVTLMELARAYAMLARGGTPCALRAARKDPVVDGAPVFSRQAVFLVAQILSDETLRMRAFGVGNPLLFGYPVAVKTGTSSNWRDSLAVGFTDRFTVAVWSGDFGGKPMHRLSGSIGAGPLFRKVVQLLVEQGAVKHLPQQMAPPASVDQILVCSLSGMAPTEHCPHQREVWVPSRGAGRPPCDWHRSMLIDRRNGLRASPRCPQQHTRDKVFEVLPARFGAWQDDNAQLSRPPPRRFSPHCPLDGVTADAVVVTRPAPADQFVVEPGYDRARQTVALRAEVDPAVPELTWFVDGEPFAVVPWPYEAAWPLRRGRHRLHAEAGERSSPPVHIEVR